MFRTSGPSPTTTSAPMLAWRMRSSPERSPVPGATTPSAASSSALRRGAIAGCYLSSPPCRREVAGQGWFGRARERLGGPAVVERSGAQSHPGEVHGLGEGGGGQDVHPRDGEIGRASCWERGGEYG